MVTKVADALAAYSSAASRGIGPGLSARQAEEGPSFGTLVREMADQAVAVGQKSEQMTAMAAVGRADLTDVVTAVTSAEVTLQTVVTVRDRIVQAYQEIMRMPI